MGTIREKSDILENDLLRNMPEVLKILLLDRSKSTSRKKYNIIWANDDYAYLGEGYFKTDEIKVELITGKHGNLIIPRALKNKKKQKERTKNKAEVFTPSWVVKMQNDAVDEDVASMCLEDYINRTYMEITCGEAPYIASRYEMSTGEIIKIKDRVGFLDRKLKRINDEIDNKNKWLKLVKSAFKASYGFEWSGDSLLLARENIVFTFVDYYLEKWDEQPVLKDIKSIAEIVSYNIFQMDGLTGFIPFSRKDKKETQSVTYNGLFVETKTVEEDILLTEDSGIKAKTMNWKTREMEVVIQ